MATWLAFFALVCHFSLSFGHVHIGSARVGIFAPGFANRVAIDAAAALGSAVDTSDQGDAAHPKDPGHAADDFCAVCAHIGLAAALILPVLAFILVPQQPRGGIRRANPAPAPASLGHRPFSARGPPNA